MQIFHAYQNHKSTTEQRWQSVQRGLNIYSLGIKIEIIYIPLSSCFTTEVLFDQIL